jgi:UDP-glucose 4-epimerase
MHISLFGHTGFFGSEIYKYLKTKKKISSLSTFSSKEFDLSKEIDVGNLSKKYKKNCTIIFCSGIKKQFGDNLNIFDLNQKIITNFTKSLNTNVKKIIYFSSASVYGEDVSHKKKINENTDLYLKSYYGLSKFISEKILEKAAKELGIKLIIFRIPLVYGVGDSTKGYGPSDFINSFIDNRPITLWGKGDENREFIYILDIVKLTYKFLNNKSEGIFNIVSGKSYTFFSIIKILNKIFSINYKINYKKRTKKKVDHKFNNKKIIKVSNGYKFHTLEEGIIKFIKSYEKRN